MEFLLSLRAYNERAFVKKWNVKQQNISSICSVNLTMPSPNRTKKEMDRIFFNLFELDPKDENDLIFARILRRKCSKDGTCAMVIFPWKEVREMQGKNLSWCRLRKIKSLQFCMKNLQMLVSTIRLFDHRRARIQKIHQRPGFNSSNEKWNRRPTYPTTFKKPHFDRSF